MGEEVDDEERVILWSSVLEVEGEGGWVEEGEEGVVERREEGSVLLLEGNDEFGERERD